jgi:hypothetical protein
MQVSLRRRDGLVAEKLLREEQVSGLAPEVARRPAQAQLTSALLDDRWHFKGHSRTLGHLAWSGLSPFSLTICVPGEVAPQIARGWLSAVILIGLIVAGIEVVRNIVLRGSPPSR